MKCKLLVLLAFVLMFSLVSGATYYVTSPTACPSSDGTNYPGQNCAPQDICGDISGIAQCYDTSTISPPSSSSTTTGSGGTDYSCSDTTCSGGFITNCYATTNCLTALVDRNATCYNKHTQTTANSGAWISSQCSATCTTNYFICDGSSADADGCEINAGASCGSGTGTIVNNQCYSSSAGNCTSGTRLDCNNDDSDSNPTTCNGANGCEITIGGVCTVGGLSGTYGSTCTGSSGTCQVSKSYFQTGTNVAYQTNTTENFLWGTDYGTLGWLINLNNTNYGIWGVNASGCIMWMDGTATCTNPTSSGGGGNPFNQNLNTSDNVTFSNINITGDINFGSINISSTGNYFNIKNSFFNTTKGLLYTSGSGESYNMQFGGTLVAGQPNRIVRVGSRNSFEFVNSSNDYSGIYTGYIMVYTNANTNISLDGKGNIYASGNITINGNNICNATSCFSLQELNTTSAGSSADGTGSWINDTIQTNTSVNVNILTGHNITSNWFKGLFNWIVLNNWLSFDGATLSFNETKLNNTISNLGVNIGFNSTYNATYATNMANNSWNQTLAGTLYAGIQWGYNQTYSGSTFNTTYNALLNFQCPFGWFVNGTLSNGTLTCKIVTTYTAGANISISGGGTISLNGVTVKQWLDTLYSPIQWGYNMTTPAITDINSRFWDTSQSWNRTQLYNTSQIDSFNWLNITSISNSTIARAGNFNCTGSNLLQNVTINSSGIFGQCNTPSSTSVSFANVSYLNNSQTFTGINNFSANTTIANMNIYDNGTYTFIQRGNNRWGIRG